MPPTYSNIYEIALKTIPSASKIEIKKKPENSFSEDNRSQWLDDRRVAVADMDGVVVVVMWWRRRPSFHGAP
ncbi:hypothetical protein NC651_018544 [Populus alba x Populus x berolinensis]|nr:hypothetical protein NC651_018544 [Populus alba x Populus x berolinensis]